jgi:hypothetical protein
MKGGIYLPVFSLVVIWVTERKAPIEGEARERTIPHTYKKLGYFVVLMKVFVAGLILVALGLVLAIVLSWSTQIVICPPPTSSCPNQDSFVVNTGTYFGIIVMAGGVALAGVDLIRKRARTIRQGIYQQDRQ